MIDSMTTDIIDNETGKTQISSSFANPNNIA